MLLVTTKKRPSIGALTVALSSPVLNRELRTPQLRWGIPYSECSAAPPPDDHNVTSEGSLACSSEGTPSQAHACPCDPLPSHESFLRHNTLPESHELLLAAMYSDQVGISFPNRQHCVKKHGIIAFNVG
uniref:Uncharacterized protein n=1 Tax=Eutreptiella gymnastica TaxID=73025 RepID=A0A7S4FRH0_9EUGL